MQTIASPTRFKSPLNYRHLRLISLIAMTATQICALLLFLGTLYVSIGENNPYGGYMSALKILKFSGQITIPLMLISVMSTVLRNSTSAVRILISSFVSAVVVYFINIILYRTIIATGTYVIVRSLPSLVQSVIDLLNRPGAAKLISQIQDPQIQSIFTKVQAVLRLFTPEMLQSLAANPAYQHMVEYLFAEDNLIEIVKLVDANIPEIMVALSFKNIFLDIMLYVSTYYLIMGTPKRIRGGKLMILRLFAAIPLGYTIAGFFLNGALRMGWITVDLRLLAALPTHAVGNYMLFAAMLFFRKYQELECIQSGCSAEDVNTYLHSERASLQMSVFLVGALCVISLSDHCLSFIPGISAWGIGQCKWMFLAVPFVLLFSSTRETRHKWIDAIYVPVYYILSYAIVIIVAFAAISEFTDRIIAILG